MFARRIFGRGGDTILVSTSGMIEVAEGYIK